MSEAKVVAILGAGPGLGVAIARRFAREGYAIALMARSEEKLQAIQTEIEGSGGVAHSFPVDATHPDSVAEGFAQVQSQLGAVSVLVYNAGVFPMAGILELTPEKFSQSWQINCFGAFLAAQQVLPSMLEQEKGTILFTGATGSLRGSAGLAGLSVGKFGLRALAQSLAREFAPRGIHVAHIIIDGRIGPPEQAEQTQLSPDAIAQTYWQLHQQDASAWTLELDLRPASEKF
ncbi:MAG: short-chain dehydrogenase [Cyanobacteria bacterium QS_3_48_167]|nr:MAG: short-chain dehydrogenase [Cyanobacteria bacterium QS_3_48_167]